MGELFKPVKASETPHKAADYHPTDPKDVEEFLLAVELTMADRDQRLAPLVVPCGGHVLDPSAGGCARHGMPYPARLESRGIAVDTIDLREDSRAAIKGSFLEFPDPLTPWAAIATNPPFRYWQRFVERAYEVVGYGGPIAMLLPSRVEEPPARAEPGSKQRAKHERFVEWWRKYRPAWRFVHGRLRFGQTGTANDLYVHFVWYAGYSPAITRTRPISDIYEIGNPDQGTLL